MHVSLSRHAITLLAAVITLLLAINVAVVAQPAVPTRIRVAVTDRPTVQPMAEAAQIDQPVPLPAPLPGPSQIPEPTATALAEPTGDFAQPPAVGPVGPVFPSRIRGVWVHVLDDVLLSTASITRMLDTVVAGGGNTVVVEVARRYDAYYASQFLPRAGDLEFEPGLDVLAEVAAGARQRGLSVHAWFTALPAWTPETAKNPEATVNWITAQHGRDAGPADTWLTYDAAGEPGDYLDPGNPAVQDLVVATAAELAAYDIDAVHLDYLRYPGVDYGYNPTALARFQSETGRTDVPAPTDPQFSDWRRQQTTDILRRVHDTVRGVNPNIGISAALIAWGNGPIDGRSFESTPAYSVVYQPWNQWLAAGLIDVAMPMLYFRESQHADFHRNWMSYVAGLRNATGVLTAPGQGSWLNQIDQSLTQIGEAAPYVDGEVLFSYQETATGQGPEALLGALAQTLWSNPS